MIVTFFNNKIINFQLQGKGIKLNLGDCHRPLQKFGQTLFSLVFQYPGQQIKTAQSVDQQQQ